jgi:hypothetical protein
MLGLKSLCYICAEQTKRPKVDMILRLAISYAFLLIFLPAFILLDESFGIFFVAFLPCTMRNSDRALHGKPNFGDYAVLPIALCGAVSMLLLHHSALSALYGWWKAAFVGGLIVVLPIMIYYDFQTLRKAPSRYT